MTNKPNGMSRKPSSHMGKGKQGGPVMGIKKGGFSASLGKKRGGLKMDGPHK